MNQVKRIAAKAYIHAQTATERVVKKLREHEGLSHTVEVLIFVVIVVVIGGVILGLATGFFQQLWQTVASRINEMFNYK